MCWYQTSTWYRPVCKFGHRNGYWEGKNGIGRSLFTMPVCPVQLFFFFVFTKNISAFRQNQYSIVSSLDEVYIIIKLEFS